MFKKMLGLSPNVKMQTHLRTEHHGSDYGGWIIQKDSIDKDSKIISAGIGNDISFDLSIINKYDCNVIAVDPTPRVSDWLATQDLPPNFSYLPVGIAGYDGETKFFLPANSEHISHSQKPSNGNDGDFIIVPVVTIKSLLNKYNWKFIDLLKMDIEGFEYDVINDFLLWNIHVRQLLVEFHHGMYGFTNTDTMNAIDLLNEKGYRIFSISSTGREISFIKE